MSASHAIAPADTRPKLEAFVDPDTAAGFLGITRRTLLQKVRVGKLPGHPGWGRFKEPKSKASKAPVPMHPLLAGFLLSMARANKVCKRQRLRVSERKAERQEAAVGLHHGTEVPPPSRRHSWRDPSGLEGTLRVSQLSPFAGCGAGEVESGSEDGAGCAAPRGFRHNHGIVCAVRHGLHAGCARQVSGTADGGQNPPAHGTSSVRIMGGIMGGKIPALCR